MLATENSDLAIRERKHECYTLFEQVLASHPSLAEKACYNPQEAFIDFFTEKRDELSRLQQLPLEQKDKKELDFLNFVKQDLRKGGPNSIFITQILGLR